MKVLLRWSMRRRGRVRVVNIVVEGIMIGEIGGIREIIVVEEIMIGRGVLLGGSLGIMTVIVVDVEMIILGEEMMIFQGGGMIDMMIVVDLEEKIVALRQEQIAMMIIVVAEAAPAVQRTVGTVAQATRQPVEEDAMMIEVAAEDMMNTVVDVVLNEVSIVIQNVVWTVVPTVVAWEVIENIVM